MNNNWQLTKIEDLLTIQNGFAFDSSKFSASKGLPLIRIRDLKNGKCTETNYDGAFDALYQVKYGDFLIGMDGEFGCYEWQGGKALLNQRVCRLKDFSKKLEPKFLFYGINKYLKEIEEATTYTTVKHLSSKKIASIELPLPPLCEQQRIVAILDEVFAGLATATANAEKNLKNARELFESYARLVLASDEVTWEKKRLSEVALEFGRGKSRHRPRNDPKLYGGPYPFIQTGDVSNADHWLTEYKQTYSALGLAQSRLWPKGTVCIAIVGATVGETAVLDFEACFPDSVIGIVVNSAMADAEFVEYLLQSFKAVMKEKGKGTARDNINLGTFESQLFPFPALEEQQLIVARLNDMAVRKSKLEEFYARRLEEISELKQSILQKAFSGELSAPPSQIIQEAAE